MRRADDHEARLDPADERDGPTGDASDEAEIRQERERVTPRPVSIPVAITPNDFHVPSAAWAPCLNGCGQEVLRTWNGPCFDCGKERERMRAIDRLKDNLLESLDGDPSDCDFDKPDFAGRFVHKDLVGEGRRLIEAPWILFTGTAAKGKTSLAKAMILRWFQRHHGSALFLDATELSGKKWDVESRHLALDLVVVDDLGAELDIKSDLAPQLIRERRRKGKRVWVTSGLTREQTDARYGEGIGRRIFGSSDDVAIFDFDTGVVR